MGSWVNYWRIVKPEKKAHIPTVLKTDSDYLGYGAEVSATQWYNQIMRGIGSRTQKYKQFDLMDSDIDISRALDTIAEEISTEDNKTNLPFVIEYQTEDSQEVNENIVTTIRAAVRQWVNIQDLKSRIFNIARTTVKFGDCFFQRSNVFKRWEYIDPTTVIGIEVNQKGEKVALHVSKLSNQATMTGQKAQHIEVIPFEHIIHFSLSDMMGPAAPFGDSILLPVLKTYKQLTMLEDAMVIYRIVRAPERRVFYIDVGNMPAQRVKQYLEQVKNDVRQKRMPNSNGPDTVDGTYNPNSIQEDYYFPVTSAGRGSRVETLPGGENLGESGDVRYFQDKVFRGLRIPTSYMRGSDAQGTAGAQVTDGKVGIAYIEELRFANYIKRLQNKIERVLDDEFKTYLNTADIKVDDELFLLKLPDPQNFALYRQAALDSELINTYNSAEQIKYLSRRFILKRYLGFSEDDLQMNEIMLKQERGILDDKNIDDLQQIYNPVYYESPDKIDELNKTAAEESEASTETPPEEGAQGETPPEEGGGELGSLETGEETPPEEGAPEEAPGF